MPHWARYFILLTGRACLVTCGLTFDTALSPQGHHIPLRTDSFPRLNLITGQTFPNHEHNWGLFGGWSPPQSQHGSPTRRPVKLREDASSAIHSFSERLHSVLGARAQKERRPHHQKFSAARRSGEKSVTQYSLWPMCATYGRGDWTTGSVKFAESRASGALSQSKCCCCTHCAFIRASSAKSPVVLSFCFWLSCSCHKFVF